MNNGGGEKYLSAVHYDYRLSGQILALARSGVNPINLMGRPNYGAKTVCGPMLRGARIIALQYARATGNVARSRGTCVIPICIEQRQRGTITINAQRMIGSGLYAGKTHGCDVL